MHHHTLHGEHIASKYYLVFTGKRQFQRAPRAHRDKKLGGVEGSKTPVLTCVNTQTYGSTQQSLLGL